MTLIEVIERLEEFKDTLVSKVAASQGVELTPANEPRIWQAIQDTATAMREWRSEFSGIEALAAEAIKSVAFEAPASRDVRASDGEPLDDIDPLPVEAKRRARK